MSKKINVTCPTCSALFRVTARFCGEAAECNECGKIFKIQDPNEPLKDNLRNTDTGPVDDDIVKTTHTVKLYRSGIGMIPKVDDAYQLGTPCPSTANTPAKPEPTYLKPKAQKAPKKTIILPEWIQIDIKEPEKILGLKEDINSSWRTPLMIFTSLILGIILAHFAGILIATVLVFVITGVVFATASKNKEALIVTNQRSIFIVDKTIIEVRN